jgi:hypothetical protein
MKKAWIALAAAALLALPATAGAHGKKRNEALRSAGSYCKSLHDQMGSAAFSESYGGSNALRQCVKERAAKLRAAHKAAVRSCKSQLKAKSHKARRHGKHGGRARFAKCVRERSRAETSNDDEGVLDAVKQCTAERDEDPVGFEDEYGSDEGDGSAFSECVSEHADDNENEAEPGDDGDVTEDPGDDSGDSSGDDPGEGTKE